MDGTDRVAGAVSVRGRAREPLFGLAGQLLNAGTNVATAFAASFLLTPAGFGSFVVAYACVTIAIVTGRGLIGATLLTHLPGVGAEDRPASVGSALGFTVVTGLAATAMAATVAVFAVPALWWFVPWMLVVMYQDAGRHVLLAQRMTGSALLLDLVWAFVQVSVLAVWVAAGARMTVGVVTGAWGAGALAGALLFAARYDARPRSPRRWTRTTRDLAGWLTGVAVIGQCEVYLVLILVGGLLNPADAGGLRAVQLVALQPALVLLGSILVLATPAFARLGTAGGRRSNGRVLRRTLFAVLPVAALVLLVVPIRIPLMSFVLPQYMEFEALVLPVALQVTTFALAVPATALLLGTRRGAAVFRLQIVRTVLVIGSTPVGIACAGVIGVAWGQVVASAMALLITLSAARRALAPEPTLSSISG